MIMTIIFLVYTPSYALTNQSAVQKKLVGTWKLVSVTHIQHPSGIESDDYGLHPIGYLNYSSDGHVMVMMIRADRPKPKEQNVSPDEAQALIKSMTGYAGTYQVKDNKIIHHIEISWNESWTGTKQVRYYKLKGNRLILTMAPFNDPVYGKISVRLVWEKNIII